MIFTDVNIFMDVLAQREGWRESIKIIDKVRVGKVNGFISSLTISILYYLQREERTEKKARSEVQTITQGFEIIPVSKEIINSAFNSNMDDFEDAIQYYCAEKRNIQAIITRNTQDFSINSAIDIVTPSEYLKQERKYD